MSPLTAMKTKAAEGIGAVRTRDWLTPLNLHWAGVGLLALVNLYLLVHMAFLWHAQSNYNADAMTQQRVELKAAEIAAVPLRGLDAKLPRATAEADRFSRERLPGSESEMLAELGALTKKTGVRLSRVQYARVTVLGGSAGELTEVRLDASLSGDYRPLVLFLNSLERDKTFFLINTVTLTGQQTGTVNLRLGVTTYLRKGGATEDQVAGEPSDGTGRETTSLRAAAGGPGR